MSDAIGDVIIEAIRNGTYLKVTAVHVATGIEATAVGPAAEPKAVERLAIAKLGAAIRRERATGG
ncbi:DUF6898 family protein [Brevundimonas sp. TWP2-3-2]|uniref:DUF6898 family protein n=1 Tax=unclassified Brevundimonas TaxID=2622653 RepID=UPI003CEDA03E